MVVERGGGRSGRREENEVMRRCCQNILAPTHATIYDDFPPGIVITAINHHSHERPLVLFLPCQGGMEDVNGKGTKPHPLRIASPTPNFSDGSWWGPTTAKRQERPCLSLSFWEDQTLVFLTPLGTSSSFTCT